MYKYKYKKNYITPARPWLASGQSVPNVLKKNDELSSTGILCYIIWKKVVTILKIIHVAVGNTEI